MTTKHSSQGTTRSKVAKKRPKKSGQAPLSGPHGWTPVVPVFDVQVPYNLKNQKCRRYVDLGDGTYRLWVKKKDQPYNPPPWKHKTKPRTEQRFKPDYTSGQWKYEAQMMVPPGSNGMCLMQIHTGDKYEAKFGATAFMLFWLETYGGSLHYYGTLKPLAPLATKLTCKWFHLQVIHFLDTHHVTVCLKLKEKQAWKLVWAGQQHGKSNGAKSFYMKDGVYSQNGSHTIPGGGPIIASPEMEVYIKNIKLWHS